MKVLVVAHYQLAHDKEQRQMGSIAHALVSQELETHLYKGIITGYPEHSEEDPALY